MGKKTNWDRTDVDWNDGTATNAYRAWENRLSGDIVHIVAHGTGNTTEYANVYLNNKPLQKDFDTKSDANDWATDWLDNNPYGANVVEVYEGEDRYFLMINGDEYVYQNGEMEKKGSVTDYNYEYTVDEHDAVLPKNVPGEVREEISEKI